jgi:hypothetical protein
MRVGIGNAPPMTMREVMVPGGEQNGVETKSGEKNEMWWKDAEG